MKYYIIKQTLRTEIIGSNYPQAHKFVKGYNPEAHNAIFSISKHRTSFPDYTPNLDGIMLSGTAKKTDFVSDSFGLGYIMSTKAKEIIEKYNLCSHRFYSLGLYIRKVKHDYYLLRELSDYSESVDYRKSTFVEYDIASGEKNGEVKLISKTDFLEKREKLKKEKERESLTISGEKIIMNKDFEKDLDFFIIRWIDASTYVSERLMNDIIANGLTGWEFFLATNLIVK